MAANSYQIIDTSEARAMLDELHERVTRFNDRVTLTQAGSNGHCVLISQAELEALERALEILSGTSNAIAMRDEVLRIAAATEESQIRSAASFS